MKRYVLELAYIGKGFKGSQIQGDLPTIQSALNKALSILFKKDIESFGASRTDEGVNAYGNIYHIDVEKELWPSFKYQMNALLPQAISLQKVYRAKDLKFNARFDAVRRSYIYRIYKRKNPFLFERAYFYPYTLDMELLKQSADILKEYTNFETFSKRNTQVYTYNCTLFSSEWHEKEDFIQYEVSANRFLRGMVRALVGTQLKVGRKKISLEEFRNAIESRNCQLADFSVPGYGLYLANIEYPSEVLEEISFD